MVHSERLTLPAARAGGINTITHVDYELTNVLGIFSAFTVHVYGD